MRIASRHLIAQERVNRGENVGTSRRLATCFSTQRNQNYAKRAEEGSIWLCTAKNRSERRPVRIDGPAFAAALDAH